MNFKDKILRRKKKMQTHEIQTYYKNNLKKKSIFKNFATQIALK